MFNIIDKISYTLLLNKRKNKMVNNIADADGLKSTLYLPLDDKHRYHLCFTSMGPCRICMNLIWSLLQIYWSVGNIQVFGLNQLVSSLLQNK